MTTEDQPRHLRVIAGWQPRDAPRKAAKRTAPPRPLSKVERRRLLDRVAGCEATELALDLVDTAAGWAKPELAFPHVLEMTRSWDPKVAADVAAALAVEATWLMPLPPVVPEMAGAVNVRQRELREWSWRRRKVIRGALARARRVLRERS